MDYDTNYYRWNLGDFGITDIRNLKTNFSLASCGLSVCMGIYDVIICWAGINSSYFPHASLSDTIMKILKGGGNFMAIIHCTCLRGCSKCRDGFIDVPFATMMAQGTKKIFNHSAEPKNQNPPQQVSFFPSVITAFKSSGGSE